MTSRRSPCTAESEYVAGSGHVPTKVAASANLFWTITATSPTVSNPTRARFPMILGVTSHTDACEEKRFSHVIVARQALGA